MKTHKKQVYNNNYDPDWVSNGKQTARKCFQGGRKTKRAHRLTSLRGKRANFTRLVISSIEAIFSILCLKSEENLQDSG